MEPLSIGLIITSLVSFLLHGLHLKNHYKCGYPGSCCSCDGEIDENPAISPQGAKDAKSAKPPVSM